jgi:septum formation topological specificity factor MinE
MKPWENKRKHKYKVMRKDLLQVICKSVERECMANYCFISKSVNTVLFWVVDSELR